MYSELAALVSSAYKRLLSVQLKEEEERIEEGEADTRKKLKAMRDHNKEWEGTRETRVSRQTCLTSQKVQSQEQALYILAESQRSPW